MCGGRLGLAVHIWQVLSSGTILNEYCVLCRVMRLHDSVVVRSLGECPHYIARCPAHSGGLSSHRLCSSSSTIGLIGETEQNNGQCNTCVIKKKASVSEKKEFSPSVLQRSTRFVSQRTEVELVSEYIIE